MNDRTYIPKIAGINPKVHTFYARHTIVTNAVFLVFAAGQSLVSKPAYEMETDEGSSTGSRQGNRATETGYPRTSANGTRFADDTVNAIVVAAAAAAAAVVNNRWIQRS